MPREGCSWALLPQPLALPSGSPERSSGGPLGTSARVVRSLCTASQRRANAVLRLWAGAEIDLCRENNERGRN
jgi:hypothetical protein